MEKSFCPRCRELVEYASSTAQHGYRPISISRAADYDVPQPTGSAPAFANLEHSSNTCRNTHCALCYFLQVVGFSMDGEINTIDLRTVAGTADGGHHTETRAQETSPLFLPRYNLLNQHPLRMSTTALGLLHVRSSTHHVAPRHVYSPSIDYALIANWLNICQQHHTGICGISHERLMYRFRVIDCQSGEVVHPPAETRYIALSYCWGSEPSQVLPVGRWPRTIEDSIAVTIGLGFRYLWVDRYVRLKSPIANVYANRFCQCIDQTDPLDKHDQIQNMDVIYNRAELTIVAAAGKNPHCGLPGVGSIARNQQRCFKVGEIELIQIHICDRSLGNSVWASRAWTLQESFLSRRKLIFTDNETIFVCKVMQQRESIRTTLEFGKEHDHGLSRQLFDDEIVSQSAKQTDPYTVAKQLLQASSRRRLSYETDAVNCFVGMLKYLNVQHWWGVIIQPSIDVQDSCHMHLDWSVFERGRRREGFPTWSWTSLECGSRPATLNHEHRPRSCGIEIPMGDGTLQTPEEWLSNGGSGQSMSSRNYLRITGSFTSFVLVSRERFLEAALDWIGEPPPKIIHNDLLGIFEFEENGTQGYSVASIYLDDYVARHEQDSDIVALVWSRGSVSPRSLPLMILLSPTATGYKRIGIAIWNVQWNVFSLRVPDPAQRPREAWEVLLPIPVHPPATFDLY